MEGAAPGRAFLLSGHTALLRTGYLSVGSVRRRSTLWRQSTRYPRLGLPGSSLGSVQGTRHSNWVPGAKKPILQRGPGCDSVRAPCAAHGLAETDPGRLFRL